VLSTAADDLLGVYEVWWQANAWYPAWPLSRRLQLAEATVTALVRDRRVRLCRGNWETAADNAVPIEETDAVLRDWATWAIPDGPHVFGADPDCGVGSRNTNFASCCTRVVRRT
jgi:cobalamin biosynthesis Mg chelatase CobN